MQTCRISLADEELIGSTWSPAAEPVGCIVEELPDELDLPEDEEDEEFPEWGGLEAA